MYYAKSVVLGGILVVGILVSSFIFTTWTAMLIGGALGHMLNNQVLMQLGFWKYAPIWFLVIILKIVF